MEQEVKCCSLCNQELPTTEFYQLKPGRLHARCKMCFKKKQYAYAKKVKTTINIKRRYGWYELRKKMLNLQ